MKKAILFVIFVMLMSIIVTAQVSLKCHLVNADPKEELTVTLKSDGFQLVKVYKPSKSNKECTISFNIDIDSDYTVLFENGRSIKKLYVPTKELHKDLEIEVNFDSPHNGILRNNTLLVLL